ncbi:MAG TPA: hypothetical protein VFW29_02060 [Solirubrobacteraceae bacterium]|nr:hypothetical protein [Solirubrobacteraceae bacterium]
MRLFQSAPSERDTDVFSRPLTQHPDLQDAATRQEAEFLGARITRSDPYTEWLTQREAQREPEQVRWVYNHDRAKARAASARELSGV